MPNDIPASARQLRAQYREAEDSNARLRLLEASAAALGQEGVSSAGWLAVLRAVARFAGIDRVALLSQDGGALTVIASLGAVLPTGARLPLGGVMGEVLRTATPSLRSPIDSRLCIGQPAVAWEYLVPLRLGARVLGMLALLSTDGGRRLDADDAETLAALGSFLAAALASAHAPHASKARGPKREVQHHLARLTAREQQVLALLPRGLSNTEIAQQLGIATGTVKIHMERILHKLGVRDRTVAALRAAEWGLGV